VQSTSAEEYFMPSRFISVYAEHAMGSGVFVIIHSLLVAFVGLNLNCVPSTYVIFGYYSHWKTLELGKMIITSNFLSNR
jgi:hypothetical protein